MTSTEEVDFDSLPLDQRINHKSWKARVSAYEQISKEISKEYFEYLKQIQKETNAISLEAGLKCLLKFQQNSSELLKIQISFIIEKGISSSRLTTKQVSADLILEFIDCCSRDQISQILEEIICGFKLKSPKAVASCVSLLREIVRLYGTTIDFKQILKKIVFLFQNSDPLIRQETFSLSLELYKWIGRIPFEGILKELKPVQVNELLAQFDLIDSAGEKPKQVRFLRSQVKREVKEESESVDSVNETTKEEREEANDVDPYELIEPVDVLTKLPKNLEENLSSSKWKDRKEILDELEKILSVPKYSPGDYHFLISLLSKRISDVNMSVSLTAITCLEKMALGLRTDCFRNCLSPLLEKFKEKKQNFVTAIRSCLNAIYPTTSLKLIIEETLGFLSNKNPNIRAETTLFLKSCLQSKSSVLSKNEIKLISAELVKLLDDGTLEVREASMECIAVLMKCGEKVLVPYLEKVDSIKMAKIREYCGGSEKDGKDSKDKSSLSTNKEKENKPPSASLSSIRAKATISGKSVSKKTTGASSTGSTAVKKKPATSSATATVSKKTETKEEITFMFSDEQAIEICTEKFGDVSLLSDSNWKIRLENVEKILSSLNEVDMSPEILLRLFLKKNMYKDSNFQVLLKLLQILSLLASKVNYSQSTLIVPYFVEKIGDIKLRKPTVELFGALMEKLGLFCILKQVIESMDQVKSPKVLSEVLKACKEFLLDFGAAGSDPLFLVKFGKAYLSNTNAQVRTAAVQYMGALYQCFGNDIKSPISECAEGNQLQALLEQEFEKVQKMGPVEPTRKQAVTNTKTLFKPVDISNEIENNNILVKLNSSNWKERKEALDFIQSLISKHSKVEHNGCLADVYNGVIKRLSDANKNLCMQSLDILVLLCQKTDPTVVEKIQLKNIVPVVCLNSLNDNKPQVREKAVQLLESLVLSPGLFGNIVCYTGNSSTENSSAVVKKEILSFFQKHLSSISASDPVLITLLSNVVNVCLEEKSVDVRKVSNALLVELTEKIGNIDEPQRILQKKNLGHLVGESVSSSLPSLTASKENISGTPTKSSLKRSQTLLAKDKDTKVSKSCKSIASLHSQSDAQQEESFIILENNKDSKEKRNEANYGIHRWQMDAKDNTLRSELVDFLKSQMEGHFSSGFINLLFSNSHSKDKDYLNGLGKLEELISSNGDAILNVLDLIFKYLTVRLLDSSTTMMFKCLDVIEKLTGLMIEKSYHLTDYEANVFIPVFLIKAGDAKDSVRQRVHAILKSFLSVYPSSKLLTYLFSALTNKNSRVRSECLDEIATVLQSCLNVKNIPVLGTQISDSATRHAAINCLTVIYQMMGDGLWKHLSKLGDREKTLLDEKLKRLRVNFDTNTVENDNTDVNVNHVAEKLSKTELNIQNEFDKLDLPELSPMMAMEVGQSSEGKLNEGSNGNGNDYLLDYILTQITSGDVVQSVDALKHLEKLLAEENTEMILPQVNALVNAITLQIRLVYSPITSLSAKSEATRDVTSFQRLLKHLINALIQIISLEKLALSLSRDTLNQMITELITRLVDASSTVKITGNNPETSSQLNRAFNVLMLRVLEKCPKNSVISVLLDLLDVGVSSLHRLTGSDLELRTKFTDLVIKCLWKLTKTLSVSLKKNEIDVPELLLDLHKFLTATTPNEWKRRASLELPLKDMPLRTAKTLIHEIANDSREKTFEYLQVAGIKESSVVYSYVKGFLEQ